MTEEPQRFEAASLVALLGAVLLFVSPFLTWFEPGGSAWQLFELLDLALIAISLYVGVVATTRLLDVASGPANPKALAAAGGAAFVAVLATIIEPPPVALDANTEFGAWLALVASALILAAGVLELARVSVTLSVNPREGASAEPSPPPAPPPAPAPRDDPPAWAPPSDPPAAPADTTPSRAPSPLWPNDPPAPRQRGPEED
ncbi:MAG: hypothetical protein JHC95_08825 [Solirubrobacteraceae bacterium]|nr:hypothetical protein [Solirubrobacteraceae bacterium]